MSPIRKTLVAAALACSTLVGGAIGATFLGTANAATTSTTTAANSSTPASSQPAFPGHGLAAHENAETAVTGAAASQAQAAAVKSVGSGTAGGVTTDITGKGYEVTVTKTDGSQVEVHLDSSFTAMRGPGGGGPGA